MDRKIVDYDIVESYERNSRNFLFKVREALKSGWKPYGNPRLEFDYKFQAIIKYEDNGEPSEEDKHVIDF